MASLDRAKLEILGESLYETALQNGGDKRLLNQKDLLDLGVIPHNNPGLLLNVLQPLIDQFLFISLTNNRGEVGWKCRAREDAQKYRTLPNEETRMVFSMIDDAGADGIWTRVIKLKLHMQDSTLKTALKLLEQKGYISEMKSVEAPNKKMYIKANLRPSDRATGGPWFNEGELDQAFIAELERLIFEYIKRNSAYLSSHAAAGGSGGTTKVPKKGAVTNGLDAAQRGKKRSATEISAEDATPAPVPTSSRDTKKLFIPLPAGYASYPTVADLAKIIHDSGITKETTLSEADVQQLVDVLVFDGLVEPIRVGKRRGYRVARATRQDPMPLKERVQKERDGLLEPKQWIGADPLSNGLTEAPCGRCPVFDLCEEGGPVNPGNCVYFESWLDGIA